MLLLFRVVLVLSLCYCFPSSSFSQTPSSVQGQWVGTLTQDQGGYLSDYTFEVFFQTDQNGQLAGKSYVYAPNVVGIFTFTGTKRGQVYYLEEQDIRFSRKPEDLSWCFKTMQLRLVRKDKEWHLEGPWQGTSDYGGCIPGWISLRWIPPRA
ncbi:MAG: hypothetical protein AAFR36_22195 [Bacteroidota bacterium]